MTFAIGHVQGGTNAGRKRPLLESWGDWPCICLTDTEGRDFPIRVRRGETEVVLERKVNRGFLARCPDCDEKRPGHGRRASHD